VNKTSHRKLLIVNGDDFGLSPGVNAGIVRAHRDGILTSATLMANTPHSRHAIELASDCPNLGLGLHANLTDGQPISPARDVERLVNPDGALPGLARLMIRAWRAEKAIRREIAAQLEMALGAGAKIDHLDSHKHVHVHPKVLTAIISVAKQYGIAAVRAPLESPAAWAGTRLDWRFRSLLVSLAAWHARRALAREGFIATDRFIGTARTGSWTAQSMAAAITSLKPGVTELMVHPRKGKQDPFSCAELDALVSDEVRSAVKSTGVRLVTYADLLPTPSNLEPRTPNLED